MTLLDLLRRLLAGTLTIQDVLNTLVTDVNATFQQFTDFFNVLIGEVEYVASLFGYQNPNGQLANLPTDITGLQTSIEALSAKVDQLQKSGQPVTLPAQPPDGWGPAFSGAVWEQPLDPNARTAGDLMLLASREGVLNRDYSGSFSVGSGLFRAVFNALLEQVDFFDPDDQFPVDWSTAAAGDTVADVLNQYSGDQANWVMQTPQLALWQGGDAFPDAVVELWCSFTQADLDTLIAAKVAAKGGGRAPVWPGLANVTLGDILDLTDGMTVDGPLDGVIVRITTVDPARTWFSFGDTKSYRNIGAIIFIDDDGEAEFPIGLGLDQGVYCPQTMTRASSLKVRLAGVWEGTIQPWTVNSGP